MSHSKSEKTDLMRSIVRIPLGSYPERDAEVRDAWHGVAPKKPVGISEFLDVLGISADNPARRIAQKMAEDPELSALIFRQPPR